MRLDGLAIALMTADVRREIVPGATRLFQEPGTGDEVEWLAREFPVRQLAPPTSPPPPDQRR